MTLINSQGKAVKSRQAQEKDFSDVIAPSLAEKNCKVCDGKGWSEWNNMLQSLIPCQCVQMNRHLAIVEKAKESRKQTKQIEVVKN